VGDVSGEKMDIDDEGQANEKMDFDDKWEVEEKMDTEDKGHVEEKMEIDDGWEDEDPDLKQFHNNPNANATLPSLLRDYSPFGGHQEVEARKSKSAFTVHKSNTKPKLVPINSKMDNPTPKRVSWPSDMDEREEEQTPTRGSASNSQFGQEKVKGYRKKYARDRFQRTKRKLEISNCSAACYTEDVTN